MVKVTDEPVVAVAAFHTHSYVSLTIVDLQGEQMCYVESLSTSGYIVPSIMLMAAGVDPFDDYEFVGSHDGVIAALYNHECDGGATFFDARDLLDPPTYPDVEDFVLPLEDWTVIPNHGFSFGPEFPAELRDEVVVAVLDIADEDIEVIVSIAGGSQGLVESDHELFSGIENLITNAELSAVDVWDDYYH
jgi:phosphonate transport system substrate-binding protein